MKRLLLVVFIFSAFNCAAQKQEPFPAADSITITGLADKPSTIALSALSTLADTTFTGLK